MLTPEMQAIKTEAEQDLLTARIGVNLLSAIAEKEAPSVIRALAQNEALKKSAEARIFVLELAHEEIDKCLGAENKRTETMDSLIQTNNQLIDQLREVREKNTEMFERDLRLIGLAQDAFAGLKTDNNLPDYYLMPRTSFGALRELAFAGGAINNAGGGNLLNLADAVEAERKGREADLAAAAGDHQGGWTSELSDIAPTANPPAKVVEAVASVIGVSPGAVASVIGVEPEAEQPAPTVRIRTRPTPAASAEGSKKKPDPILAAAQGTALPSAALAPKPAPKGKITHAIKNLILTSELPLTTTEVVEKLRRNGYEGAKGSTTASILSVMAREGKIVNRMSKYGTKEAHNRAGMRMAA